MWRDDYDGGWEFRRYALKYRYMVNVVWIFHTFSKFKHFSSTNDSIQKRKPVVRATHVVLVFVASGGDHICRSILILSCISTLTHHHVVFNNTSLFPQQARTTPPLIDFAQVNARSDSGLQVAVVDSVNLPLPAFLSHF